MQQLNTNAQLNFLNSQLSVEGSYRGDPLDINLAELVTQANTTNTAPDGSASSPITIEAQEPVPTQPVFNPERFFLEQTGQLGTILLALFVINKWFNLGALIGSAVTYMRNQNQLAERLISDSKKMVERFEHIDSTHRRVGENHEELVKIRRDLSELLHQVSYFYTKRADFDPERGERESEDELRKRRHS